MYNFSLKKIKKTETKTSGASLNQTFITLWLICIILLKLIIDIVRSIAVFHRHRHLPRNIKIFYIELSRTTYILT